jgi:hypothetical protein
MTPSEIVSAIDRSHGHLCARITRSFSGSLVMLDVKERSTPAARAASFVLGMALATGVAKAQTNSVPDRKALVSGRFTDPKGDAAPPGSQVVFVKMALACSEQTPIQRGIGLRDLIQVHMTLSFGPTRSSANPTIPSSFTPANNASRKYEDILLTVVSAWRTIPNNS